MEVTVGSTNEELGEESEKERTWDEAGASLRK